MRLQRAITMDSDSQPSVTSLPTTSSPRRRASWRPPLRRSSCSAARRRPSCTRGSRRRGRGGGAKKGYRIEGWLEANAEGVPLWWQEFLRRATRRVSSSSRTASWSTARVRPHPRAAVRRPPAGGVLDGPRQPRQATRTARSAAVATLGSGTVIDDWRGFVAFARARRRPSTTPTPSRSAAARRARRRRCPSSRWATVRRDGVAPHAAPGDGGEAARAGGRRDGRAVHRHPAPADPQGAGGARSS